MIPSPERIAVPAGCKIFEEGAPADRAYLVLSGIVILSSREPAVSGTPTRRAGELVGELALVDGAPRATTATAMSDCELLAFTGTQVAARAQATDPLLSIVLSAMVTRYGESAAPAPRARTPDALAVWTALSAEAQDILSFESQLRAAIERQELVLHFQPIVRLSTGRLAGFETLIRWHHPRRGLLSPNHFIPFAESVGMIADITALCFRQVGALFPPIQAAADATGGDRLFVTINISASDLAETAFASKAVTILGDAGIEPEDVKLEITESVVMPDIERCTRTLENCRDQGFAIAIDDFGTGYSSLHYLSSLPISVLKIDRSFCQSLLAETPARKITEAILRLGHELGLSVVAEGVETTRQRDLLTAMGCDFGQGYLFGKPLDQAATLRLVHGWAARDAIGSTSAAVEPAA